MSSPCEPVLHPLTLMAMEMDARAQRRALAEKILLKLIRISPHFDFEMEKPSYGDGVKMAWDIADAFLKAENT